MIVVADSTPLITLMKAGRLDILERLFGEVRIPSAVFFELTSNKAFSGEAALIRESDFVRVVHVEDEESVALLRKKAGLDLGESEALIYAKDKEADLLLMDEAAGRRVAREMCIPIAGSVGVLVAAARRKVISSAEADIAFERIRASNRHISERLIRDALAVIHGNN